VFTDIGKDHCGICVVPPVGGTGEVPLPSIYCGDAIVQANGQDAITGTFDDEVCDNGS
jgi:hypothetical protein